MLLWSFWWWLFTASASEGGNGNGFLKQLFFTVKEATERLPGWPNVSPLLIVDDLSILTSLGCKQYDVSLFFQDLQTILCPSSGSVVSLIHTDHADTQDESRSSSLYCLIVRKSDMIISVQPLKTGYCRDISGEVLILIYLFCYKLCYRYCLGYVVIVLNQGCIF